MADFDETELPPAFDGMGERSFMRVGDHIVPRACSVEERSPLYHRSWVNWGLHVNILVDGVKLDHVISYDVDAGAVRICSVDPDGALKVEDDRIVTDIVRGAVELRPCG